MVTPRPSEGEGGCAAREADRQPDATWRSAGTAGSPLMNSPSNTLLLTVPQEKEEKKG